MQQKATRIFFIYIYFLICEQMSEFETGYQALGSYYDDHDDQEGPPTHIIHAVPSNNKGTYYYVTV